MTNTQQNLTSQDSTTLPDNFATIKIWRYHSDIVHIHIAKNHGHQAPASMSFTLLGREVRDLINALTNIQRNSRATVELS